MKKIMELVGESSVPNKKPVSWGGVEKSLGLFLPEDYKSLVSEYFTFNLGPISLVSPRPGTPGDQGLLEATQESEEIFTDLYVENPAEIAEPHRQDGSPLGGHFYVFNFYPKVPGLLKWGKDYNGSDFYWYVNGPPSEWTIVAQAREGWWDEHKMSVSAYLYGLVSGEVECDVVAQSFDCDKKFVEWPWPTD
ncbi:hypothetical protein [Nocardiopsis ganjiahuensis]|uniref:hypothetical protein n=1 Tax=Nocardiopsis ganjiahuensis TaxID=239984 RepID=UPI0012694F2F|nr:hypothetical protein [Nocardiopsis ganjiahuensis]